MDMAPLFRRDRRIVDDAFAAYAAIALFFDTIEYSEWKGASMFRKSKLLDQAARAKEVPDRRTFRSNKTIPKEFWKPWDRIRKDNNRHPGDQVVGSLNNVLLGISVLTISTFRSTTFIHSNGVKQCVQ